MTAVGDPLQAMESDGLVPLYSSGSVDNLYARAVALVDVGISTFEVTLRSPGSLDALRSLLVRADVEALPLAIGAGTVMDPLIADAAIGAGARFIFSPVLSKEVAGRCRQSEVPYIPGCATPTEIHTALELGCGTVKLFPADAIGGPGFLRAVRSVFPDVNCIPSGGIRLETSVIRDWFDAGAVAVGMGSGLFPSDDTASSAQLLDRLRAALATLAEARQVRPA